MKWFTAICRVLFGESNKSGGRRPDRPFTAQRASLAPRGYLQEDLVFVLEVNETYKPWLIERDRLFQAWGREAGNAHRIAVHVDVLDDYRPSRTNLKSSQVRLPVRKFRLLEN